MFSKTEEPLDADDWLQTMENNLEVAGVEANDKVLFATHYLAGPARAWWTSARALNAGQLMTWADFKLKFSKYHVPPGLIKKMRDEFRELKQGRLTVVEYRDKFLTLSRVGPATAPSFALAQAEDSPPKQQPPAQMSRPGYQNRSGGNPRTGGHHPNNNNFVHHNNNFNRAPTRAPANPNTNTAPRTGAMLSLPPPRTSPPSTAMSAVWWGTTPKSVPRDSPRWPPTPPALLSSRVANNKKFAPNNPNNRSGRLFHMSAEEAQEAPDVVLGSQKSNASIDGIKSQLAAGKAPGFTVDEEGVLWYNGRLCVPSDSELKQVILKEAHDTLYSIHPGGTKMYQDLKEQFWWHGMKREIGSYIAKCDICRESRQNTNDPQDCYSPQIPEWKWDSVGMDFITGLPKSSKGNDSIWVVVDV
ncbi:hypothetical protein QYE76_031532 [Lolium multiflorum]|uniref:Retrotransposon gag domain-containing protein n=1 Tax=Lolium multiflorum TaxID=4521 RepID=A0AAD8QV80_LOLMU|nr:hypothetical protein QYE76_031532 [Lolium multiflorum]